MILHHWCPPQQLQQQQPLPKRRILFGITLLLVVLPEQAHEWPPLLLIWFDYGPSTTKQQSNRIAKRKKDESSRERMAVWDWCKRKGKKRQTKTMKAMNVPYRKAKLAAKPAPSARLPTRCRNNNKRLAQWLGRKGRMVSAMVGFKKVRVWRMKKSVLLIWCHHGGN